LNNKRAGRLSGLEVLRGLAATSIVIFHLNAIHVHLPSGPASLLVSTLSGAVPLFFALSAFSLLYGYRDRLFDEGSLKRFYLRRVFRILPLFYVMLLIYYARATYYGGYVSKGELLINSLFLFPFFPGKHESLVWAGWSLGVEWCFYILFPVFALISREKLLSIVTFLIMCALSLAATRLVLDIPLEKSFSGMNFPKNLVYFQAGVMTFSLVCQSVASEQRDRILVVIKHKSSALLLLTFLLLISHRFTPFPFIRVILPSELFLAFVCCIWIVIAYLGLPAWVDNVISRSLGKLSYGIYLLHPFVLSILSNSGIYGGIMDKVVDPYLQFWGCALVSIAFTLFFAELAYRLVESPGIRLGEKVISRMSSS